MLTNSEDCDVSFDGLSQLVEEWRLSKIELGKHIHDLERNKSITLLFREIREISFPNLVSATLWRSNIASIEGIHRLRAPNLNKLWLSKSPHYKGYNKIISIKDLTKATFP